MMSDLRQDADHDHVQPWQLCQLGICPQGQNSLQHRGLRQVH